MTVVSRVASRLLLALLAVLALLAAQSWNAGSAQAAVAPTYDGITSPLPPSMPSLGYQATQTVEFGDLIELAAGARELDNVVIGLVDWACETGGGATCVTTPGATWTHPITVNVYAEGTGGLPGALLGTVTQTVTIPFRPSADPTNCNGGTTWFDATTSTCSNGFAFTADFDFSSLILTLPDRIIVTVAYDTQSYGASPRGVTGPYDSLNVGLVAAPTVGTDADATSMYWNTGHGAFYNDLGAGGAGTLRDDIGGWTGYSLAVQVNTGLPLPTLSLPDSGGGAAGGLPTLAATGSEPSAIAGVAGLLAVLLGVVLVATAPRRVQAHRA
ncbi:hypothetical protein [Pseudolysinimonas sp.]|jgi:hypothetical protein|uniref:hypothetical protein n=1 Tax=Pseudolysinimonas sp. TaxID=2680009 RepID=UPI003782FDA4